jgi:glycosyltransferase involved in cell wall biosynthesis
MTISVVIPTFNRSALLRRALASVFAQPQQPDEVIVIDDGSTDDTAAMLGNEFPAIRYIRQANSGISSARNLGIKNANSDWLAFLDSDDEWLPEKLFLQTNLLNKHPEHKICHTEEIWVRNGVRVNPAQKYAKPGGWIFNECLPLCAISPSTVMIHRSVFTEIGLFDTDLPVCEDYDMWLRITAKYPVALITQAQAIKHGGHQDQLSQMLWGMDRYRIIALQKIIASKQLNGKNQQAAIQMLLKKSTIYLNGAIKRGKTTEANHFRQLIAQYQ